MARVDIHPDDIIKPIVWKSRTSGTHWCVAWAINGVPVNIAARFGTWREAMDCALGGDGS